MDSIHVQRSQYLFRNTEFTELIDATIYPSIQISRDPFRNWIPSCRTRRATS